MGIHTQQDAIQWYVPELVENRKWLYELNEVGQYVRFARKEED